MVIDPFAFFWRWGFFIAGLFFAEKIDVFAELIDTYIDNRLRRRRGAT
jgi:hypothetical protein